MGTRNNPGAYDCYAKAEPDEPMFVLLGRDRLAPGAVRRWATERYRQILEGVKPETDMAMVREAFQCAGEMELFREQRDKAEGKPRWDFKAEPTARLLAALRALVEHEHISLGDLVYNVRERAGLGWDGPGVISWGKAVANAEALVKELTEPKSEI